MKKNAINKSAPAVTALLKDERGMSTVEYVILLAVIVMGAVSVWNSIGGKVISSLQGADDSLTDMPSSADEAKALGDN